jgi:uncharacterized SAM-binding protein YcdF (DUF218 family)
MPGRTEPEGFFKSLRTSRKVRRAAVLLLVVFVLMAGVVAHTALSIWRFDGSSPGATAEAAIVLGASVRDGKPSPVFQARIDHAVSLLKQGRVNSIILTGGTSQGNDISDAEIARDYAVDQGVPPGKALAETQSRTTRENLFFSRRLAKAKGIEKFIVVSDPLHMKRAMAIAQGLDMSCVPSATPTTRYSSLSSRMKFAGRETYYYFVYLLLNR